MIYNRGIKSGFTLIELLVVVTILGLLAIVVLPAFTAGGDKRLLRGAADRLDTHLKHAAARATGKPRGSAVWLDANGGTAVFDLNFARMPTGTPLSGKVKPHFSGNARFAEIYDPPVSAKDGSVVHFDMVPSEFRITQAPYITFPDGETQYNSAFPISALQIDYVVYEPPSGPRITSRPTVLPDRVCVDLASSTIGVYGFSAVVTPFQEDIDRSGSLNGSEDVDGDNFIDAYTQATIVFDVRGRLCEIWASNSGAQQRFRITASEPVALLVTLGYQSGLAFTSYSTVTEDNPGAGWQNPDAFWVVIDPKTGRNIIVQNYFEPTSLQEAQTFIRNDLLAQ